VGTAYADPYLDLMFEEYNKPKSVYYVVENNGKIVGSAGVAPHENEAETICELQKMYFLPETRGQGMSQLWLYVCKALKNLVSKLLFRNDAFYVMLKIIQKSRFRIYRCSYGKYGHVSVQFGC
jgi:putative acetyltransferase